MRPTPLLVLLLGLLWLAPALEAQERRSGAAAGPTSLQEVTSEHILRGLVQSGLTRDQVRTRLRDRNVDPTLIDPYYDRMENRSVDSIPQPEPQLVRALVDMGVVTLERPDFRSRPDTVQADTLQRPRPDSIPEEDSLPVFGRSVFSRAGDQQLLPVQTGPVPPDYRLGPGDELELVLTGDVELTHILPVSREGSVVIPDVGRVSVNGLTLGQLEDRLYDRLGGVYSGVRRGADASTRFQVSLGRLRVNQVFVVGEVERPGTYEISSVGTALSALYRSGGPDMAGSFRSIQVRRGGEVVAVVDLYEYLLTGDTRGDMRLHQGDVVFVPLARGRVRVTGAVRREAIYEILPGEGLEQVIAFAGGPSAEADVSQVRIARILPFTEQTPGRQRVLEVVDLLAAVSDDEVQPLSDGDVVTVPSIGDEQRDRVALEGYVYGPGEFELVPGMTVWDLVSRAGGLRPDAFEPVAHVRRLVPSDSSHVLLRVSLQRGPDGTRVDDLRLEDRDEVTVFGRPTLLTTDSVAIIGEVKEPGTYSFDLGMTAQDLILTAGGFTPEAQGMEIEVARLRLSAERNDTVSHRYRLRMGGEVPWEMADRIDTRGRPGADDLPLAGEFTLLEGDQVFVRRLPGYVEPRSVEIHGEVLFPGPYAFTIREERLSSFVARSGGVTTDAHLDGARLERDSLPVGIDLAEALENPGSGADPVLEPGDRLVVPVYDGTVVVQGAVAFDSRVVYEEGKGLDYYLAQAGGTLDEADEGRIFVSYQNGARATTGKTLWIKRYPDVRPGSTIHVPIQPEGAGTDWRGIITTSLSVLTTTATLLLAIGRL